MIPKVVGGLFFGALLLLLPLSPEDETRGCMVDGRAEERERLAEEQQEAERRRQELEDERLEMEYKRREQAKKFREQALGLSA